MAPLRAARATILSMLSVAAVAGCASTRSPLPLDARGEKLLAIARAEDRRDPADPSLAATLLGDPDPAIRARAALAIGRVGDAAAAQAALVPALGDPDPRVRREVAFALGLAKSAGAFAAIAEKLLADADPATRAAAMAALGRLGSLAGPLGEKIDSCATDPDARVRGQAALAAWRGGVKPPPATLPALLRDADDEVRWRAAYALMQLDHPASAAALAAALRDRDARVRLFSARALGRLFDLAAGGDAAARAQSPELLAGRATLVALLSDPEPQVVVEAVIALGRARDAAAVSEFSRAAAHESFHVREAVLRALAETDVDHLVSDDEARVRVKSVPVALLADPSPTVRRAAVLALPRVLGRAALPRLLGLARNDDPMLRARVAEALAALAPSTPEARKEIVHLAREDSDRRVREAALGALRGVKDAESRGVLVDALACGDLSLVSTAATVLGERGDPAAREPLVRAYGACRASFELTEARASILEAVDRLGGAEAKSLLESGLADPEPMVRRKAAELLAKSGGDAPKVSLAPSTGSPEWALRFEAESAGGAPPPLARIRTGKGDVVVRLFPGEAPLATESFLRLASQRFYDGLVFHRVVANWVVQGGDPRGDGWGGYRDRYLLDQFTSRPFLRGTLGVPTSGPDTGGCQIFACLVPAPNLDGRYTAFGEVIEGLEILDRIEIGDVIEGVDVLPSGPPAAVRSDG